MQWWHKTLMDIGLNKRQLVVSWEDLKECMRARFVPPHYRKDLLLKLQRFHQDTLSVDAYFKELETMLIKIDMHESEESKMTRFVSGLKREIQDVVELHEYSSLENLVHIAIKVESQLSKKASFQKPHNDGFYHTSSTNNHKSTSTFPSNFKKESTYKTKDSKPSPSTLISSTKTSSKKCFKCLGFGHIAANYPTKRIMMVKGDQVVSEHSDNSSRSNSPSPSKSLSEYECEIPCEGDLLMIRRTLGTILKPLDDTQRENIFHTRCLISNKLCSLIIDGGSCTNVASTRVVEKLALPTISHTKPYKLQWLSAKGEIMVNKQVLINFSIEKYKDEVLCDVVPMEATHVLVGRSWQYDRHVLHDGLSNTISFCFQGRKVTLKLLSTQEVHEDQIKIKIKRENEKAKEGNNKSSHTTLYTKSLMLTRAMPQLEPPRYSSSLSFSLLKVPTSTPSWLKNVRNNFSLPPNGVKRTFSKKDHHSQTIFSNMVCL